jgi:hypothetical protein
MKAAAGKYFDILNGVASGAVASTGVFYSESFPIPDGDPACVIDFKFTSAGAVKCKLEMEQSHVEPATEGSADANFIVPATEAGAAKVIASDITDEVAHSVAYAPVGKNFGRIKITGVSGNDASTVVDLLRMNFMR